MRLFGCSGVNITGENAATASVSFTKVQNLDDMPCDVLYHSEYGIFSGNSVKMLPIDYNNQDLEAVRKIMKKMDVSENKKLK